MSVGFVQLMKGGDTSELAALRLIPNIAVSRCDRDYGFFKNMSDGDISDITACHNNLMENAFSAGYELIILDEFCSAYEHGLMDRTLAERLILNALAEVALTGRNPAPVFKNAADYISVINCEKHPFEKGIAARRGIEL